jgi:thiol-disulfide isomerase/thioredoxin
MKDKPHNSLGFSIFVIVVAVIILLLLGLGGTSSGYDNTHKTYWDAIETAKRLDKPLFVLFTSQSCSPCQELKNKSIEPMIIEIRKTHVVHYVDVFKERDVAECFYKLPAKWRFDGSLPTYYLVNRSHNIVKIGNGFRDRVKFRSWFRFQGLADPDVKLPDRVTCLEGEVARLNDQIEKLVKLVDTLLERGQ